MENNLRDAELKFMADLRNIIKETNRDPEAHCGNVGIREWRRSQNTRHLLPTDKTVVY